MTWRKTITYWALFFVLAGYYWVAERRPAPPPETAIKRETILDVFADEVKSVTFRREGLSVRCEIVEKRWRIVDPKGAVVPADLISTLVDTLTEKQESEVVADAPQGDALAAFGLDHPTALIDFEMSDGRKLAVEVGARNPTRTAVYARTGTSPRVLLVGLNVQYYSDLIFEAGAKGTQRAAK